MLQDGVTPTGQAHATYSNFTRMKAKPSTTLTSPKSVFVGVQVAMNPTNTVFDAKRLIGRKVKDPSVQADMKHWPFKIVSGPADKPMLEGDFRLDAP
jgi:hypothetical protein